MKQLNILVTGNGFDLHHHMKTKYSDVIEFFTRYKRFYDRSHPRSSIGLDFCIFLDEEIGHSTLQKIDKYIDSDFLIYFELFKDKVDGWVDFEKLIRNVTKFFRWFIKECKEKGGYMVDEKEIDSSNRLIANSFSKIIYQDGRYYVIKDEYKNNVYGVDDKKIIECLRADFDIFCNLFEIYLWAIEPKIRNVNDDDYVYKQINDIKAEGVITFNYTNSYARYNISDVAYIHGCLDKGNIVLGFDDDEETELEYVYFKKYFQCIIKKTEILEKIMSKYNNKVYDVEERRDRPIHIHFFGHSLDETDREELVQLLNWGKYVTVYFLNVDDMSQKVIKLINLLGKKNAVSRIHDGTIAFEYIDADRKC